MKPTKSTKPPTKSPTKPINIGMVGCGYVGLVSGACFADLGNNVIAAETNAKRIKMLRKAQIPIYEPTLEAIVRRNLASNRLKFVPKVGGEFKNAEVIFLAVGTPSGKGEKADLSQFFTAATEVARIAPKGAVVVSKSTVPMGTTRRLQQLLDELAPAKELVAAANPEFLREGSAVGDFIHPHRVVIGGESPIALARLKAIYAPLKGAKILCCNWESAELIKYAANGFLATKITFINEIADIAAASGADIRHIKKGLGLDKRIGKEFLEPGPGYGGACLPKDVRALGASGRLLKKPTGLMEYVNKANQARKRSLAQKVINLCGGNVAGKRVAVLGLTFKPETDDTRESAAYDLIAGLVAKGAVVTASDPKGSEFGGSGGASGSQGKGASSLGGSKGAKTGGSNPKGSCSIVAKAKTALKGAEVAVLLTHWSQYTRMPPAKIKALMKGELFIDFRNGLDPEEATAAGLDYHCLGITSGYRINPSVLRAYDVRGVFGKNLFAADGYHLARAFVAKTKCREVAVCYDARLSSPQLEAEVVKGIQHSGATAIRLGLGPTPALYQSALSIGGVMITASHNPKEYNGFKFVHKGEPLSEKDIKQLGKIIQTRSYSVGRDGGKGKGNGKGRGKSEGKLKRKNGSKAYINYLLKQLPQRGLTIAWDCANAAAAAVIPELVKQMEKCGLGKHYVIGGKVDGNFPLHHPDPEKPENMRLLQQEVLKRGCDVGFAFDGDADRLGVVDNKGKILQPQTLSAILIADVLLKQLNTQRPNQHPKANGTKTKGTPNEKAPTIVVDVKSGATVTDAVLQNGGRLKVSPCGHTNINKLMRKTNAVFGIEMSGHIFFKDRHYGYDDGIYAALRFWEAVLTRNEPLDQTAKRLPTLPMHKATYYCDDTEKFAKVARLKQICQKLKGKTEDKGKANGEVRIVTMDGVKCFQDGGWWLVRASNTEPKIMLAVEHQNQRLLKQLTEKALRLTQQAGMQFS